MSEIKLVNKLMKSILLGIVLLSQWNNPIRVQAQDSVNLVIHTVNAKPIEGKLAYTVDVLLSVLDSAENPIKELKADNFAIAEDGQSLPVSSVESVSDKPINLVLVIDTSSNMTSDMMNSARKAADRFVSSLQTGDRVAILNYDDSVTTDMDFTSDILGVREEVALLNANPSGGACMYDAAYKAIQSTTGLPAGRRAVILFTSGIDQSGTSGKTPSPCSTHTLDDVINLATDPSTRVPVYVIGVGNAVDTKSMNRLVSMTGGRYLYAPMPEQLASLFLKLADQLRWQYTMEYTSTSNPGAHTITVSVRYLNMNGFDTQKFVLPDLPPRLIILAPTANQQVQGPSVVSAVVYGQGKTVAQVIFKIGDTVIGTIQAAPYQWPIDFGNYPPGALTITVIAQAPDGSVIASNSVTVQILPPGTPGTTTGTPSLISGTATPSGASLGSGANATTILLAVGITLLVVVLVGGVILIFQKKKAAGTPSKASAAPAPSLDLREAADGDSTQELGDQAVLGVLIVLQCDDRMMINRRFEISKTVTKIGRSAENDIIFAQDSPVSRFHARILRKQGELYLTEVGSENRSAGSSTTTYGTRVNGVVVGSTPVLLHDGDEILLGKRTRLRFKKSGSDQSSGPSTMDNWKPFSDTGETTEIN